MEACFLVYGIYAGHEDESDDADERPQDEVIAEFVTNVRAEVANFN